MEMEAVLREAVTAAGGSQAELARAVGVTQSSVSRWVSGQAKPDYESCLRIARLTGHSPVAVLDAAGHDHDVLVGAMLEEHRARTQADTLKDPIEQEIRARMGAMREALRGIPQDFWPTIIRKTFDQAISSARDAADLARELAATVPERPVKRADGGPVERPASALKSPPAGHDADFRPREAGVNPSGAGAVPRHAPLRNLSMVAVAHS